MFKVSTSLERACLHRLGNFLWTALAKGFRGRSFQIISSLVRRSSIVDGLLSSSFCLRDCKIVMLTTHVTNLLYFRNLSQTLPHWCHGFIFQQDGAPAHATQDWSNATAINGHQTHQILWLDMHYVETFYCKIWHWRLKRRDRKWKANSWVVATSTPANAASTSRCCHLFGDETHDPRTLSGTDCWTELTW